MALEIFKFLTAALDPIVRLVDDVHTSEEEKLNIKTELTKLQNSVTAQLLNYEGQLLASQTQIITAEAQGQGWLQRSWRPITMLTFLVLVVCDSFGLLAFRLADQAWQLLQIGLGGYVVGRSAEKIAPQLREMFKK